MSGVSAEPGVNECMAYGSTDGVIRTIESFH